MLFIMNARTTRAVELVCEAESTLRVLLRDKDPKNQIKSAEVLLKHRYIPPEITEPNAMPDDGQERRTQAEWAEIEQTRAMDTWRQARGLPPYTSLEDRLSELKLFYEAGRQTRLKHYRRMLEMEEPMQPSTRSEVEIAASASGVQETPQPAPTTPGPCTSTNGRLLVSLAVMALALGTLGGALALGLGTRALVVPVAKDSKIDTCDLNAAEHKIYARTSAADNLHYQRFHAPHHQENAMHAALAVLLTFPAADSPQPAIEKRIADEAPSLIELYKDLHAHPELGFQEVRTAARMAKELKAAGFEVTEKVGGTGIVAVLKNGDGPTVMVRADMDGLPIIEKTGLPTQAKIPFATPRAAKSASCTPAATTST